MVILGMAYGIGLWHWVMATGLPHEGTSKSPKFLQGSLWRNGSLAGMPGSGRKDLKCILYGETARLKKKKCFCLKEIHRICKVSIICFFLRISGERKEPTCFRS